MILLDLLIIMTDSSIKQNETTLNSAIHLVNGFKAVKMNKLIPIGSDGSGLLKIFEIEENGMTNNVLYSFNNGAPERAVIELEKNPDNDINDDFESCFKVGTLVYFMSEIMRLTTDWDSSQWAAWQAQSVEREAVEL